MHDHHFNSYIQLSTWKMHYILKSVEKNPGTCASFKICLGVHVES